MVLKNQKYGNLTFLRFSDKPRKALFRCDCGKVKEIDYYNVEAGEVISCGCMRNASKIKHGLSSNKLYFVWTAMVGRCTKPNHQAYDFYGGRGISVCTEWLDVEKFFEWAKISGYSDGLTLDRIDNNKDYAPDNCRWVNMYVQTRNRRSNVYLDFNGKHMCLTDWARELNIPKSTLSYRYAKGWPTEKMLAIYS